MSNRIKSSITLHTLLTILTFSMVPAQSQNTASGTFMIGDWKGDDEKVIRIYEEDGQFFGKPVYAPGELGEKLILKDIEFKNERWQGMIFAPKRQKYYKVAIRQVADGELKMKVSAGMISKTLTWSKVG